MTSILEDINEIGRLTTEIDGKERKPITPENCFVECPNCGCQVEQDKAYMGAYCDKQCWDSARGYSVSGPRRTVG